MRSVRGWAAILFALAIAPPAIAAPRHVVSAFLCTDEYVFRLLPRDRIAALSFLAADRHPVVSTIVNEVKGIPLVHDSAEEILSRDPDAVVLYAGTQPRLHAQLRQAGIPIIDVAWANSLADIRRITLALGRALGVESRAQRLLAAMDRRITSVDVPTPRVRALIYEPNGYATSDNVTAEIMARAGLDDAADAIGLTRSGTIPVEDIVAAPPELLVLNGSDDRHPTLANRILHHPALAHLRSRVMVTSLSLTPLLCPGPWSVRVVKPLAQLAFEARALARARRGP